MISWAKIHSAVNRNSSMILMFFLIFEFCFHLPTSHFNPSISIEKKSQFSILFSPFLAQYFVLKLFGILFDPSLFSFVASTSSLFMIFPPACEYDQLYLICSLLWFKYGELRGCTCGKWKQNLKLMTNIKTLFALRLTLRFFSNGKKMGM